MAFLKVFGKIIEYKDAEEAMKILREHALNFILNWKIDPGNLEDTEVTTQTKFGYEFEVFKVFVDDENKNVQLDLSGEIDIRNHAEVESKFAYQNEYAKYMVEGKFFVLIFSNS